MHDSVVQKSRPSFLTHTFTKEQYFSMKFLVDSLNLMSKIIIALNVDLLSRAFNYRGEDSYNHRLTFNFSGFITRLIVFISFENWIIK